MPQLRAGGIPDGDLHHSEEACRAYTASPEACMHEPVDKWHAIILLYSVCSKVLVLPHIISILNLDVCISRMYVFSLFRDLKPVCCAGAGEAGGRGEWRQRLRADQGAGKSRHAGTALSVPTISQSDQDKAHISHPSEAEECNSINFSCLPLPTKPSCLYNWTDIVALSVIVGSAFNGLCLSGGQ